MLQSYEAIYNHGTIKWVSDRPVEEEAMVIVTMLPPKRHEGPKKVEHTPSLRIAGKGKILGDILSPVTPETDWNVLK